MPGLPAQSLFDITREKADRILVHATAVAKGLTGTLIIGKAGSGKSTLAHQAVRQGWRLVGDDQIHIIKGSDGLYMCGDHRLKGLMSVRDKTESYPRIFDVSPGQPAKLLNILSLKSYPLGFTDIDFLELFGQRVTFYTGTEEIFGELQ